MDKLALKHFVGRIVKDREVQTPQPANQSRFKDATLLIVDDSRTILHTLKFMLERFGFYTILAANGEEAIEAAHKWTPDLVLLDIVMPRMNGFETIRSLSQERSTQNIPIIMMSGNDRASDRMWSARLGAKGFLAKPIRMSELLPKIDAVLSMHESTAAKKTKQLTFSEFDPGNKTI